VSIPSGYSLQDRQRHYWQTYLQVIQRMLQQILCCEPIEFTTDVTGDFIYTGKAFISNFDLGAETGTSVKVSISFTGNGNITKQTVV
jgi:hypothetical protein